ncbi:MAG: mitochondrial fission ELM1 family protein [Candidatus Omnitrophica bacterium]|nr:mitochondrial fission ELM1 family protein [Candidatus Omnitrophota bacterium]
MVRFLSFFVCIFPISFSLFLARVAGTLFYYLFPGKAKLAYLNLRLALGDKFSLSMRKMIVKELFRNLTQNIVEFLYFPRIDKKYVEKYISVVGEEKIKEVLKREKGLIFLTGHLGNWELLSLVAQVKRYPIVVLAREQKPKRLNALLNQYRTRLGARLIIRGSWMREVLNSLKENKIVGILGDQKSGKGGVLVGLFSRLAWTPAGVFNLASHTGAGVLPVFIIREKGPYHRIEIKEELSLEKNPQEFLRKFHRLLEEYILNYPSQWLWFHRRWKGSPSKKIIILSDGKVGHLNQARALAKIVKQVIEEKSKGLLLEQGMGSTEEIEIEFKHKFARFLINFLGIFARDSCRGCLKCLQWGLRKDSLGKIFSVYGDIIISCGTNLSAVNLFLAKENQAKSIIIMKPGLIPVRRFDLAIIPLHDRPKPRRNVVITPTALNLIDEFTLKEGIEKLQATGYRLQAEKPKIGVLIGGESKYYTLTQRIANTLINELLNASRDLDAQLLITTSRRTSQGVEMVVKERLSNHPHCPLLIIANERNIEGAVWGILGLSDIVVVSEESISMISEALSAKKPVIVFKIERKIQFKTTKYQRFLDNLFRENYLTLVKPEELAEEIKKVYHKSEKISPIEDKKLVYEALRELL